MTLSIMDLGARPGNRDHLPRRLSLCRGNALRDYSGGSPGDVVRGVGGCGGRQRGSAAARRSAADARQA
jgi:hypothetical protein